MLTDADRTLMRADALQMLPDRCEIRHPTTTGMDEDGHETQVPGDIAIRWQGQGQIPCSAVRVGTDVTTYTASIGGQDVDSRRYIVSLPYEIGPIPTGLQIVLAASSSHYLAGRRLTVDSVGGRTGDVLRRVLAVDNLDP